VPNYSSNCRPADLALSGVFDPTPLTRSVFEGSSACGASQAFLLPKAFRIMDRSIRSAGPTFEISTTERLRACPGWHAEVGRRREQSRTGQSRPDLRSRRDLHRRRLRGTYTWRVTRVTSTPSLWWSTSSRQANPEGSTRRIRVIAHSFLAHRNRGNQLDARQPSPRRRAHEPKRRHRAGG
jgi:hypothetical protein